MKTPLTFLLSITFLFLFSGSVYGGEKVLRTYWDNGNLKLESHYNGKEWDLKNKDGRTTMWYESGKKEYESYYKNGIPVGTHTKWHKSGGKAYENHYKNGKVEGLRIV